MQRGRESGGGERGAVDVLRSGRRAAVHVGAVLRAVISEPRPLRRHAVTAPLAATILPSTVYIQPVTVVETGVFVVVDCVFFGDILCIFRPHRICVAYRCGVLLLTCGVVRVSVCLSVCL